MTEARRLLVATGVLVTLDVAGAHVVAASELAERLFAGGARGAGAALCVALLLGSRIALYFFLPGYALAAAARAILARVRERARP